MKIEQAVQLGRYTTLGATLGGPVPGGWRDKLFFFINYDGIREIHPGPTSINFPSVAMTHGDFSALCASYSND